VGGNPDPAEYSASIDWGDGTAASPGAITFSGGTFTVAGDHTYGEEGSYSVKVTISHGTAPDTVVTASATVTDPAVALNTTALSFSAVEGITSASQPVATFTDPGGAEVIGEYAATIDW